MAGVANLTHNWLRSMSQLTAKVTCGSRLPRLAVADAPAVLPSAQMSPVAKRARIEGASVQTTHLHMAPSHHAARAPSQKKRRRRRAGAAALASAPEGRAAEPGTSARVPGQDPSYTVGATIPTQTSGSARRTMRSRPLID
ncbi:hypothetical protein FKP32DRAFT_1678224 [Trametes sanguinea]|nr:hypothetical protein FKP32DRAFT_1678224 [Trametes sanguinea]